MRSSHIPLFFPRPFRQLALVTACALAAAGALAADGATPGAQERYNQEVARCNAGTSQQDRATCLREAGAALEEARKGNLNGDVASYTGNSVARCDVFQGEQRSACRSRILGPTHTEAATITRGSVNEGGILRESIQVVPVPAPLPAN
jgi:hypothetical protein